MIAFFSNILESQKAHKLWFSLFKDTIRTVRMVGIEMGDDLKTLVQRSQVPPPLLISSSQRF